MELEEKAVRGEALEALAAPVPLPATMVRSQRVVGLVVEVVLVGLVVEAVLASGARLHTLVGAGRRAWVIAEVGVVGLEAGPQALTLSV